MVGSYSSDIAPRALSSRPFFSKSRISVSTGSESFLVSHQSTFPSVEAEKNSVPDFDCNQTVLYAGSRWLFSINDCSTATPPFRISNMPNQVSDQRTDWCSVRLTNLSVVTTADQLMRLFRIEFDADQWRDRFQREIRFRRIVFPTERKDKVQIIVQTKRFSTDVPNVGIGERFIVRRLKFQVTIRNGDFPSTVGIPRNVIRGSRSMMRIAKHQATIIVFIEGSRWEGSYR